MMFIAINSADSAGNLSPLLESALLPGDMTKCVNLTDVQKFCSAGGRLKIHIHLTQMVVVVSCRKGLLGVAQKVAIQGPALFEPISCHESNSSNKQCTKP